ncbi:MAG: hypothetical protein AAGM22_12240 [Acidobacteriota bacterium]
MSWDTESRRIERLKMYRPRAAAQQSDAWLSGMLAAAKQDPRHEEHAGRFASALSTWAGIQRTLGQLGDAVLATQQALDILSPQLLSTRAGFACQRAAFLLGDLQDIDAGLRLAQQAVAIHGQTPGGRHHVGVSSAGVGAYELFYRRAFADSRAALRRALGALPEGDDVVFVGAHHGIAYSYLMEGRLSEALEALLSLRQRRPNLEPDQDLRLRWLEAEIAAAAGDHGRALAHYEEVFTRGLGIVEVQGAILVSFDVARILLERPTSAGEWWSWNRRLGSLAEKLTRAEQAALGPYLDALAAGDLDRGLLDHTTVAFKRASNRMLLGMGRRGAAGRPELGGQFAA